MAALTNYISLKFIKVIWVGILSRYNFCIRGTSNSLYHRWISKLLALMWKSSKWVLTPKYLVLLDLRTFDFKKKQKSFLVKKMKIKSLTPWISQGKENFRRCNTANKNRKEQVLQLMIFYRRPTDFKK